MQSKNPLKWLILLSILFIGVVCFYTVAVSSPKNPVTATKPKNIVSVNGWKDGASASSAGPNIMFKYPDINTTYIKPQVWPPQVFVSSDPFACQEDNFQGNKITVKKTINGTIYCVTESGEGAAGSIYTTYTYSTEINYKTVTAKFTLRYIQCDNYPEPQRTECLNEQQSFDLDSLVEQIVQTVKV